MYYLSRLLYISKDFIATLYSRLLLKFWGIDVGRNNKFSGVIKISKYPRSNISIGSNNTFLSTNNINKIGLYTPCCISTLNSKSKISIGSGCGFSGTVIAASCSISIGNQVRCGANTLIVDTDFHSNDIRAGVDSPVKICDEVWLGYGVKVLKGVTIGKGALIGAMSVVTSDIPEGVVAAGIPCKVIKKL